MSSLYKLTVDVGVLDSANQTVSVGTLQRWQTQGRVELVPAERSREAREADAPYNWPGAPKRKPSWRGGKRGSSLQKESGGANFRTVAAILFPGKDPLRLAMGEINNIAHLIRHHSIHHEVFVTVNRQGFIDDGRRDGLKSAFGIVIMTPDETVAMLKELQGWKD